MRHWGRCADWMLWVFGTIVMPKILFLDESGDHSLDKIDPQYPIFVLCGVIFECGAAGGSIIVEGRSPTLDNALNLAFLDLKIRGTQYLAATKIAKRIHNFTVRAKKPAIAGLEIADVVATPIGRHVHGKATYPKDATDGDFF